MKKLILPVLVALAVSGCGEPSKPEYTQEKQIRTFCDGIETKKAVADFTLQCIANANPKSDEEPEDWIHICKRMAVENFCEDETVTVFFVKPPNHQWPEEYKVERINNGTN